MVTVEVVGFLFAFAFGIGVVAYLRQGFVAVGFGVEIGISAVRLDFLQEVALMLRNNEIVKKPMFQTTSKKIVRSSEKQKPRACCWHAPYILNRHVIQAAVC